MYGTSPTTIPATTHPSKLVGRDCTYNENRIILRPSDTRGRTDTLVTNINRALEYTLKTLSFGSKISHGVYNLKGDRIKI